MGWSSFPFHKCKLSGRPWAALSAPGIGLTFPSGLALPLLVALAPQQFPIDLGDAFQVRFDCVVVLDPAADLFHLVGRNDSAGRSPASQRDRQIPKRPMSLPSGAPAGCIAAGDVPLHQRAAQDFGDGRELLRQAFPALAQGQFRHPS